MSQYKHGEIDVVSATELSLHDFQSNYLDVKIPVIITDCMKDWRCCREWVLESSGETQSPDLDFLSKHFGSSVVPVVDSETGEKTTMTLSEFCSDMYWERASGEYRWKDPARLLYLKDWHFAKEHKQYCAYKTPCYFRDDWLNDWFEKDERGVSNSFSDLPDQDADYKFCYLGPAGSKTRLHTDVIRSNSWSAQIAGRKEWKLLDPKYSSLVENEQGICHMQDFEQSESAKELITHIVQYPGQIFYVPANWHHQVLNLDNSLSINHNWVDSSGLNISWQYLTQEHMIAERMIEDIRDLVSDDEFAALVNRNVLLNCGMNKQIFLTMVDFILQHMSSPRRATFGQLFKQGLHPV